MVSEEVPKRTKRQFARCKAMSGAGGKADLPVKRPELPEFDLRSPTSRAQLRDGASKQGEPRSVLAGHAALGALFTLGIAISAANLVADVFSQKRRRAVRCGAGIVKVPESRVGVVDGTGE